MTPEPSMEAVEAVAMTISRVMAGVPNDAAEAERAAARWHLAALAQARQEEREGCVDACHGVAFKGETRGNPSTVVHVVNACARAIRNRPPIAALPLGGGAAPQSPTPDAPKPGAPQDAAGVEREAEKVVVALAMAWWEEVRGDDPSEVRLIDACIALHNVRAGNGGIRG